MDEDEKEKPTKRNHLKAKKNKIDEEETIEAVNLPNIPLPISNLPRFDIALPQQQYVAPSTPPQLNKSDSFKFASPIKFNESARNLESMNNFTFSKPLTPQNDETDMPCVVDVESTSSNKKNETTTAKPTESFQNFKWSGPASEPFKLKEKNSDNKESPSTPKVANRLEKGSIMDYFAKKPIVIEDESEKDKWECSECLIKNNGKLTHCIACKRSKKSDSSSDIEIIDVSDEDGKQDFFFNFSI